LLRQAPNLVIIELEAQAFRNVLGEAVDQALYQAKVEGRSQYKLAEN
jgi:PleD family two-component response regulator